MPQETAAPTPALVPAFTLDVEFGPVLNVGQLPIGGARSHWPVSGGRLHGEGLDARLAGGSETRFARADGITVVEASYYIEAEGACARAFGTGYLTTHGDFTGTRLTLLFEAEADSPLARLAGAAYVAERASGGTTLAIHRIA
ncbi:DUF3237 family protein [Erythrobacter sp. SG61-1L]|uniref:DUF3237 family protein n=1 Tax=Erythrobacter sp. SG61-1L TaxID=1603897 RepID=UPI0006C9211B|nr:DUF3237 family protein [Erythrobacter sp. SG61-1L]